ERPGVPSFARSDRRWRGATNPLGDRRVTTHAKATYRVSRCSTAGALLASLILAGAITVTNADGRHDNIGTVQTGLYRNHSAAYWAWKFRRRTRQLQAVRHELRHKPTVVEAINLTCAVYGWCSTLWRKAGCETGGTYSPTARNASGASGLFQFLPSTWRSTPFARFSI